MMFLHKRYTTALALALLAVFAGCTKPWSDHNQLTDDKVKNNLYEAISKTTNLGKFSSLLVKTGYDKVIASSKTYTVWAPTDQALQSLDPAVLNDTAKLKLFVGNHISNQSYLAGAGIGARRIQMFNGKYINTTATTFDSANIVTANQYASNGVFHIIDKFIPRYDNCWEWLRNSTSVPLMKAYLLSLDTNTLDHPVQIGVDPNTGQPIYQPGVGYVLHNKYLDSVMNISDEANLYTFVVLTDAGFTTELNKIAPYFKTGTPDSTQKLSGNHLVKDFAFKGLYTPSQLPQTLVSQYGVSVPLNTANLVASYKTSNGIVYVMSDVTFTFTDKFPPIVIQGENPNAFAADRSSQVLYRIRKDSATGRIYNDLLIQNYNYASYWINYKLRGAYTTKYNISWVAVNDVQTTPLWQQRLGIDSVNNTTNLPYVTVAYKTTTEVALGSWTLNNYRPVNLFVIGPTTASSSGGSNSISIDYIKLTPLP